MHPETKNVQKMNKPTTGEIIQQVASGLFRKFGFEKTSMDDIAQKAHKAKRSIYNYFSNKEELFCSTVISEIDHIQQRLTEIMSDDRQLVLPRLRQYLLSRVELIAEAGTLQVAMKDKHLESNDFRFDDLRKRMAEFSDWEHQVFKKVWYAKPTTDTPETIERQALAFADMLSVTLNGLSHTFFVEEKYEQYKPSYEMLIDLIVNSVFVQFANTMRR